MDEIIIGPYHVTIQVTDIDNNAEDLTNQFLRIMHDAFWAASLHYEYRKNQRLSAEYYEMKSAIYYNLCAIEDND